MKISVEEAYKKKIDLEIKITELLQEFQDETGLFVTSLDVPYTEYSNFGGRTTIPVQTHPVSATVEFKL